MKQYKQLTSADRYILSHLRKQGLKQSEIARQMGRHRSTISREVNRNRCWTTNGAYRPSKAVYRTKARRSNSRRNKHYSEDDFKVVRYYLKKKLSPEQIVGTIRRFKLMVRPLSHETIYQYIWQDKANGGVLWTHLRQSNKRRRKRYNAYDSRGRLANKKMIFERPDIIETRKTLGHWEIDTVMGKGSKDCIITLVERKSGYVLIGKLPNRKTVSLNKRCIKMIRKANMPFLSITSDNGTEFHQYKVIEKAVNTCFYFARPYHSWERGTNENTNGLIRQYLRKGTSMAKLTQQKCEAIAKKLNERPRKRHQFKTPEEVLFV
jgi:IS30 family transposase